MITPRSTARLSAQVETLGLLYSMSFTSNDSGDQSLEIPEPMEAISHDLKTRMGRAACSLIDYDRTMQYKRSMSPGYSHIPADSIRINLGLIVTCVIELLAPRS